MDVLGSVLDGPRAQGAFLLRSVMTPPWSVRVQDRAPVSVVVLAEGAAWVIPDGSRPAALAAGDVAVLRGPDPYVFADDPATEPQVVIHPGQRCSTPDGHDLAEDLDLGVRSWGNDPDGSTTMLIGTYEHCGDAGSRVLASLPPLVVIPGAAVDLPVAGLLGAEIVRDEPGQQAVLDRLLDLVLVGALRWWFARPEADAPGWYRAQSDAVVGPALRLLQHNPDHPWTVAALAAEVGVSRAGLARRFTELVGEPPMSFLTGWRLALAADLLSDPTLTIGAVAARVGYGSAFALSAAFKRHYGRSPREHRRARGADRRTVGPK